MFQILSSSAISADPYFSSVVKNTLPIGKSAPLTSVFSFPLVHFYVFESYTKGN